MAIVSFLFAKIAYAQTTEIDIEPNSLKIKQYYQMDKLKLPFEEVITLSTDIVRQRSVYDPNTLAKTYALLADIAEIKGESSRAFQLANYGLTYKPIASDVKLNLKLKLAAAYFLKNDYADLVEYIEEVISLAERVDNKEYRVIALAYRAMANAFLGLHDESLADLLVVEKIIESNEEFSTHVELYEILAISQCYLGNDDVALSLYNRILDKRFKVNKLVGIETTYAQLAQVYLKKNQYDDAYNAYWESKNYAKQFQLPIRIAYAELGIGKVLAEQGQFERSFKSLIEAESLFKGQNLNRPYLETLINLIVASQKTGRINLAQSLLLQAEQVAGVMEVVSDNVLLYQLLASHYETQGNHAQALIYTKQYAVLVEKASKQVSTVKKPVEKVQENQGKIQALKVVEVGENKNRLSLQLYDLKQMVLALSSLTVVLIVFIIYQWLSFRSQKLNFVYDQNERPEYILMKPTETKQLYHRVYKKARKYEYPLTVGYIEVKNWPDLVFQYNKKIVNEVAKTIATLINEHIGEFDYAGQINDGEYLIMYPHQSSEESSVKMDKLVDALKVRFFANLGDFSVNIGYSLDAPSVQDIDPYIFLSRLSET